MLSKDVIVEVSRAQRERERRERAEKQRADQIANARARQERDATVASAQRAMRQARITRQLDPEKQFQPKPEPQSFSFGGVPIPQEYTDQPQQEPEPTDGYYVFLSARNNPGGLKKYFVAVWYLPSESADFTLRFSDDGGYREAVANGWYQVITTVGQLAKLLHALRESQNKAVQLVVSRQEARKIEQVMPGLVAKIKYYIDHNMDDFVNYEETK